MKKTIALALVCSMLLLAAVPAWSAVAAEVDFTYAETDGGLVITGYVGSSSKVVIPASIDGKPVVAIGSIAFHRSEITSITLPDSVKRIENSAFNRCSKLSEVNVGAGLQEIDTLAFFACGSLREITLPSSLKRIGDYAFDACGLTSIEIPDSVDSIGEGVFIGCTDLKYVKYSNSLTEIPEEMFTDSGLEVFRVPQGVTYIASFAFGNSALKYISIPDTVQVLALPIGTIVYCNDTAYAGGWCVTNGCKSKKMEFFEVDTGHPACSHRYGAWQEIREATCVGTGKQQRFCELCGLLQEKRTPALGHIWKLEKDTPPSLSAAGQRINQCSRCEEREREYYGSPSQTDSATGVSISADAGVFAAGTAMNVKVLTATDSGYADAEQIAGKGNFIGYHLDLTSAPKGAFSLSLPIPAGENAKDYCVVWLEDRSILPATVSGKTLQLQATEEGVYLIAKKSHVNASVPSTTTTTGTTTENSTSSGPSVETTTTQSELEKPPVLPTQTMPWVGWAIGGIAFVVIVGIAACLYFMKKKK